MLLVARRVETVRVNLAGALNRQSSFFLHDGGSRGRAFDTKYYIRATVLNKFCELTGKETASLS